MVRLPGLATRRAGWVLAAAVALTALAATRLVDPSSGAPRLTLDASIDALLPADAPERRLDEHVRRLFGSDETLVVALLDDDVFRAGDLRRLRRIARRIAALPEVQRVVSLDDAPDLRAQGDDVVIEPFLPREIPDDPPALAALRRRVLDNPLAAGTLAARDGRAAAIVVTLRDLPERALLASGVERTVRRIAREEAGDARVAVTGGAVLKAETSRLLVRALRRVTPLVLAVVTVVAIACFRSLAGLVVPLAAPFAALVWTLGAVAAAGVSLNLVTALAPTLILVVGFAYAVHVVAEYQDRLRTSGPGAETAQAALERVALPVALSGLTTGVGLLALAANPIGAIRQFAVISTLGVAASVVSALSVGPALLALLPPPRATRRPGAGARFDAWAGRLARFDVRRRTPIFLAAAALACISIWGAARIRATTAFVDFPAGSPILADLAAVDAHLGGATGLRVVLATDHRGAFTEPANLRELEQLQDWLDAQPEIGATSSLVDYLALVNRAFHGGDPAALALPDSRSLVEQLLFFTGSDELRRLVDSRYQTTEVRVRARVADTAAMSALVRRIEARLAMLPPRLHGAVTGDAVLVSRTLDQLVRGQATSLAAALAAILAILALLFTSLRVGLLALLPNALPVVVYYGALGIAGVTLNTTTGLVACIVLGIAVDDTIHLLARFNVAARQRLDEAEGVAEALRAVGRPMLYTSAALCLGLLALLASPLRNHQQFGALAAFTLAVAALADATFTPALAARLHIVTLWDALTLDLGHRPQDSIPLFAGLRETQARLVALTAGIRTFPRGHLLMRAGEAGHEMFVVLDGQLNASARGREGVVDFGNFGRGSLVGEVALFHGRRTADVRAVTDVRLLRLTRRSLERLARRYPRTAARVYANLSRILADRVASTTDALR